jgi:hypothetical protein
MTRQAPLSPERLDEIESFHSPVNRGVMPHCQVPDCTNLRDIGYLCKKCVLVNQLIATIRTLKDPTPPEPKPETGDEDE